MREIKFRAWDKKRKRMYEILHLHLETPLNGGVWATVKGYDVIEQKDIHIQIQPKDIELMQYTGLKDKNGKEIYESDLVQEGKSKGKVIYKDDGFEIEWVHNPEWWSETLKYHAKHLEVIGNIYENPELLQA